MDTYDYDDSSGLIHALKVREGVEAKDHRTKVRYVGGKLALVRYMGQWTGVV